MAKNIQGKKLWIFHHYATPPTMNGFTRPYDFGVNLLDYSIETTVFSSAYLHFSNENLIKNNENYIVNNETEIPHIFIKTKAYSGNGIDRVQNMLSYYRNLFKITKKYVNNNDENKPDYILASSPHPLTMIAGIKIAKKLDIPCICEVRDFWPEVIFLGGKLKESSMIGKSLLKMEHWIYKNADALIFLKEGDYTYISDRKWDMENGGDIDLNKSYYINNGVDIDNFNQNIEKYNFKDPDLDNDKFKIVYTGAIRAVNNIDKILDAAKLVSNFSNIQFLIYGNGNKLEELKKRVKDENIDNVKFKGEIDKKYIPYVLSNSSVNILNYSQKKYNWSRGNSSNKLFEYLASGKPIISTIKMGYSIIRKANCGIELEDSNSENLATAIIKIKEMTNTDYNEISKNALKEAEKYDYSELTKRLIEVIESF